MKNDNVLREAVHWCLAIDDEADDGLLSVIEYRQLVSIVRRCSYLYRTYAGRWVIIKELSGIQQAGNGFPREAEKESEMD